MIGAARFLVAWLSVAPAIDLSAVRLPEDDKEERWNHDSVHEFEGTYGDYVLGKVSKVFPELRRSVM